jgi:cell division protein FtsB
MDNLRNNFNNVVKTLLEDGMNFTAISTALGYTTTTQLNRATAGIPSAKAIAAMIENLKVNPNYLFLGKGSMFFRDETDEEKVEKLNTVLQGQMEELEKEIKIKNDEIRKLKDSREELLEILVRTMKEKKAEEDDSNSTNQNPASPD